MTTRRWKQAGIGAVAGLVATPVATLLLGALLYGGRSTWGIGQGESFLVFLTGVYLAPLGAAFGALVLAVIRPTRLASWLGVVAVWLMGVVSALVLAIRAFA